MMVEGVDFLAESKGLPKIHRDLAGRTIHDWSIPIGKDDATEKRASLVHGWDVCPNANGNCIVARYEELFYEVCSVDYENCEIKQFQDGGFSR